LVTQSASNAAGLGHKRGKNRTKSAQLIGFEERNILVRGAAPRPVAMSVAMPNWPKSEKTMVRLTPAASCSL